MAVPFGYGRFGRCENGLPVFSSAGRSDLATRNPLGRPDRSAMGAARGHADSALPRYRPGPHRLWLYRARSYPSPTINGARPFSAPADGRLPTPRATHAP